MENYPEISLEINNPASRILEDDLAGKIDKKIFNEKIDLKGKWSDFKINYKLEKDGSGFTKVFLGDNLITEYKGPMGYPYSRDLTYFKMGLYRDESETPQTIYLKDFGRAPTKKSISKSL